MAISLSAPCLTSDRSLALAGSSSSSSSSLKPSSLQFRFPAKFQGIRIGNKGISCSSERRFRPLQMNDALYGIRYRQCHCFQVSKHDAGVYPAPEPAWLQEYCQILEEANQRMDCIERLMREKNVLCPPRPDGVAPLQQPPWVAKLEDDLQSVEEPAWFQSYVEWMAQNKQIEESFINSLLAD